MPSATEARRLSDRQQPQQILSSELARSTDAAELRLTGPFGGSIAETGNSTPHGGGDIAFLSYLRNKPENIHRGIARIIAMRIDADPFFGAFHALAVDDGSGRARFAFGLLAARDIERTVDAIESALATPPVLP